MTETGHGPEKRILERNCTDADPSVISVSHFLYDLWSPKFSKHYLDDDIQNHMFAIESH